jgi:hypothetical protein
MLCPQASHHGGLPHSSGPHAGDPECARVGRGPQASRGEQPGEVNRPRLRHRPAASACLMLAQVPLDHEHESPGSDGHRASLYGPWRVCLVMKEERRPHTHQGAARLLLARRTPKGRPAPWIRLATTQNVVCTKSAGIYRKAASRHSWRLSRGPVGHAGPIGSDTPQFAWSIENAPHRLLSLARAAKPRHRGTTMLDRQSREDPSEWGA